MIRLSAPSKTDLDEVMKAASTASPTHLDSSDLKGFAFDELVGSGQADFEAAKAVLRNWQMHKGAGVAVDAVPLAVGTDVVLWTRVLGLALVFACRITDVYDNASTFGFTYATLPGHPEQGFETFRLEFDGTDVRLHISGESRPALLLNKLSGPIGPIMQKRFIKKYVEAVRSGIAERDSS